MNSVETTSKTINIKKSIIIAGAVVFIAGLLYLGYTVFLSPPNPCESLFKQTTRSVHQKIEALEKESPPHLENAQIQKLSSQAQQAALSLKTCCILFHEDNVSFEEFLKCQDGFNNFEMAIDHINELIEEMKSAEQEEKKELVTYKSERLHQTLQGLDANFKTLQERIHHYTQRSPGMKAKHGLSFQPSVLTEAEPNDVFKQATEITMGNLTGALSESDKKDYFKFEVASGNILKLDFTPDEAAEPMKISLRNIERQEIWSLDTVVPGVTKSTKMVMNTTSGGTFFIIVSRGNGNYRLTLASWSQNDAGSGNDAADKIAKAMQIKPGRSYLGELGGFDGEDWYQFEIPPGHILNLAFRPDSEAEAMNFSLRNFERNEIWYFDKVTPGVTKSKRVITNSMSGGKYYLAAYDGQGAYTFEITSESQNDASSGTDAGDKITKAIEIRAGHSYTGELGGLDEEDWYQFEIPNGHIFEFAFTPAEDANVMVFELLNYERREVWRSGEVSPAVTKSGRLLMNSTSGGTYFLKVHFGGGVYQLDLHTKSQNDAEFGTDAGDRIARAVEIKSGRSFFGELGGLDQEDWYTFAPQRGERLNFTCDLESEPMRLELRTLEQGDVGYSAEIFPGMTKSFEIPEDVNPPYFIRIFDGRGKYSVELK
jgi:uncharacterized protein YkuJ